MIRVLIVLSVLLWTSPVYGDDLLKGLSKKEVQRFEEAQHEFVLLKCRHRAPFYGVLITVTDLKALWANCEQRAIRIKTLEEHTAILESTIEDLRVKHTKDLLDSNDRCNDRVGHAIKNCPVAIELPCVEEPDKWYESPFLWSGVSLVVGIVAGVSLVLVLQ